MHQVKALELSPDIQDFKMANPISPVVIVGSTVLAACNEALGIGIRDSKFKIADLDGCGPEGLMSFLLERGWRSNVYRGVITVRKDILIPERDKPVTLDLAEGVHKWSYNEVLSAAIRVWGHPFMNPEMYLEWLEAMRRDGDKYPDEPRAKDIPRIAFLKESVIPRLGEFTSYQAMSE